MRVLVGPFAPMIEQWQQVIVLISILSMVWGSIAAIVQKNIKRLMAYSSIGHVGYALIGLAVGNEEGARGLLFYLLIYLFMNVGTFAVIMAMRVKGRYVEEITVEAHVGDMTRVSVTLVNVVVNKVRPTNPIATKVPQPKKRR